MEKGGNSLIVDGPQSTEIEKGKIASLAEHFYGLPTTDYGPKKSATLGR